MSHAIAYAIIAMIAYGIADFVSKQSAAAGIRADHFLMAQAWFFCPLVIIYALATGTLTLHSAVLWGSLAGFFVLIGRLFFVRSLAGGSVSVNASIFRLNFMITAVLAIAWLGEPLTPRKLGGLALAAMATYLLVGAADADVPGRHDVRRRSLIQVGIGTVAFGVSNFLHVVGLRHGALPESLAVAQAAVFMPLATTMVYVADRRLAPAAAAYKFGAAAGIGLAAGTILLLHSVARGEASALVPIAQMAFIVTALLGILVLGERFTARKAMGLLAALLALTLLAVA